MLKALLFLLLSGCANVPAMLEQESVSVVSPDGAGSGTLITRNHVNYVWTAGHVVSALRMDTPSGVVFGSPVVSFCVNGERIHKRAKIIKYSEDEDLALLQVLGSSVETSTVFDDHLVLSRGTELYYCGSFWGAEDILLTTGIINNTGYIYRGKIFDQTSCTAFPGASGGGVFLKNGSYVGMLVRTHGETANLIIPLRRIREWAKKSGVEFAVNSHVPVPNLSLLAVE